jgi:SAM-dependent methyltransferase
VYFLTQSDSLKGLQAQGDELLGLLEADMEAGAISAGFVPAMLFPGRGRQERNLAAWRHFWTPERRGAVQGALEQASAQLGFSAEAFDPFLQAISTKTVPPGPQRVPEALRSLLGISKTPQSDWIQTGTLVPGTDYAPESVYQRYADVARLFDPSLFSLRLGELLFSTFVRMLVIIGISVVVLLLVFFVDWKLTLISLLPVLFALISTLGTLRLAGHPLDIPGLMLSIVVVGMGVDYSLFLVRSYQRSGGEDDSGFRRIQMAVFLASASTMIGFGALCLARHALLRSAGFTSLLGIAYAAFGAFLLLPPLLKRFFQDEGEEPAGNTVPRRAAARYRRRGAYPRLFARWKIRLDPMFFELPRLTKVPFEVARIMDIGCGYGVPGCWLLERFQRARLRGMDPDPERVRIAGRVFGARGVALQGQAPMVPAFEDPADLAVMLDMAHFLPDEDLALTFRRVHANLGPDRRLVLRVAVYPQKRPSLAWRMEALGYRFSRTPVHYRSADHIAAMMAAAGFAVRTTSPSGRRGELIWIIGERR